MARSAECRCEQGRFTCRSCLERACEGRYAPWTPSHICFECYHLPPSERDEHHAELRRREVSRREQGAR